jgi:hypothetical protein
VVNDATMPEPLRGVYEFVGPGEEIELYRGDGAVDADSVGPVRVWLPARRNLRVRWKAADPPGLVDLNSQDLSIVHPQFGPTDLPASVSNGAGWGTIDEADLGRGHAIARVLVHWVNLPMVLPGLPIEADGWAWRGRWAVESCGWRFTLDSRRDLSETFRAADELDEQFVFGHVGEVRRVDGHDFDAASATRVLLGWQLAMSFALGRWVAPALPVGFDSEDRRVWEKWVAWKCDPRQGSNDAWWNPHRDEDLSEFFDAFLTAYLDPNEHPVVKHFAAHIIVANHARTTGEGKVMLAQAGLEYLNWVTLVLSGRMTKRAYRTTHDAAATHLRQLLTEARIEPAIPADLDGLGQLAHGRSLDGPAASAWVRNRLTHPKNPEEPYRITGLVWQTAQLLLEYGELLMLHRLGYNGHYVRRYPPGRWVGTSEPVPWATTI